jgi:Mrp family chromosome partitioning ATPase
VSLIVTKALKMANMMNIKVLGVIENMSYIKCPDCGKKINLFGESHLEQFAKDMNFNILGRLPLVSENATLVDKGDVEKISLDEILPVVETLEKETK